MASDLDKGSKSVKIDGEPTALEDESEISTSTGDEGGTQGGNVVTHKTKGKGYFKTWSLTVKIEGKGVCRHGDMMGQNSASLPPGCVDASAVVTVMQLFGYDSDDPCDPYTYNRDSLRPQRCPNDAQTASIQGQTCWVPGCPQPATVADHQPPLNLVWMLGGCKHPEMFNAWAHNVASTPVGHCSDHSGAQGRYLGRHFAQSRHPFEAVAELLMELGIF
jgi:uncharacterized Zn-binding protein involved in type VI secretion